MPSNPPLTDEEICHKFGIPIHRKGLIGIARDLCNSRPDRIICEVPTCYCPHCGQPFTATYEWLASKVSFWCGQCQRLRLVYIEHLDSPDDDDFDPDHIMVTFNTDPEPPE